MIEKYNYLKDDIRPGEKFNAKKQCQQSFDKSFIPHVTSISPFEVISIYLYSIANNALSKHRWIFLNDAQLKSYDRINRIFQILFLMIVIIFLSRFIMNNS